jgi:hypothetical protein
MKEKCANMFDLLKIKHIGCMMYLSSPNRQPVDSSRKTNMFKESGFLREMGWIRREKSECDPSGLSVGSAPPSSGLPGDEGCRCTY